MTIKDVARECGLSTSTVSLALSDKPSRVSPQTRARVREVAQCMGYRPNRLAVGLATKRSRMIGIVLGGKDLRNQHVSESFMSISTSLRNRGYALLYDTADDSGDSLGSVSNLVSFGVEGLVFGMLEPVQPGGEYRELMDYVQGLDLPIVFRNYNNPPPVRRGMIVRTNFENGGYLATRHLLDLGHRRIGCIAGDLDVRVSHDRLRGYRRALEEAGLPYEEGLVFQGDFGMDSGSRALPYLLGQSATAVFAFNDLMAFGVYRAARSYGVGIPRDLSLVGFDNTGFGDVLSTPLTSVDIHTEQLGEIIAGELIRMIEQGDSGAQKVVELEPNLIVRSSAERVR